ncbi:hypothetical protein D0Y65_041341 [Glycine soja]|uniref:Uncharacterized protein n=1 Tax=Glycine soja TaxID=3848 RepID=A0A445GVF8_GLYSO|nr:hypothetical protein D0Y65_041341 [Glycine soja]
MGHMRSCKFVFILSSLSSNSFSNELFHVQSTNCVPFRSRESEACSHGLQNRSRWFLDELKHIKWRPPHIGTKQGWQDRTNNMRRGRKEVEVIDKVGDVSMASTPFYDENMYILNQCSFSNILEILIMSAKWQTNSIKDFVASSRGSSSAREKANLSLSLVKALVLREKEDKLTSEFTSDEKVAFLINSLFDQAEKTLVRRKTFA